MRPPKAYRFLSKAAGSTAADWALPCGRRGGAAGLGSSEARARARGGGGEGGASSTGAAEGTVRDVGDAAGGREEWEEEEDSPS